MEKIGIKKAFVYIFLFFLIYFYPLYLNNKTLLTNTYSSIVEGVSGYSGGGINELYRIDPGGSAWIDQPLSHVTADKINKKKLPLWNEYSGAGTPLFANQVSNSFSIIRYLVPVNIFPNSVIWDFFLVFRLIILSVLTYVYLKILGLSFFSSIVSSILISICGHVILYINLFHLDVEVVLPLILIGFELLIKKNKIGIFLIPLSVLLLVVGGNIQSTTIGLTFFGLYMFLRLIFEKFNFVYKLKFFIIVLILILLGLLISSFYLFPFVEFFINSFNVHSVGTGLQGFKLETLPSLIYPFIFGPIHSLWININQHYIPSYFGFFASLLFLYGCFKTLYNLVKGYFVFGYQYIYPLMLIFLIFFLKIFNFPIINNLGTLPIYNRIVFVKYLFPVYLCFFILLSFFIENIYISKQKINKTILYFFLLVLIILFASGLLTVINNDLDSASKYIKLLYIAKHSLIYPVLVTIIFMLSSIKNVYLYKHKKHILLFLFLIEIFYINFIFNKKLVNRYESYDNPTDYVSFLKSDKLIPFRIYGIDRILLSQISAGFKIEDLRNLDALVINNYMDFMRTFITGSESGDMPFFSGGNTIKNFKSIDYLKLLNTRYVLVYKDKLDVQNKDIKKLGKVEIQYSDKKQISSKDILDVFYKDIVFENTNVSVVKLDERSRAFIPSKVVYINSESDSKKYMLQGDFDILNTIVISKENIKNKITICNENNKVTTIKYEGDRMVFLIDNYCEDGVLFLSNSFYPGWKAYIDEKETNIMLSDLSFQSIKIPKGKNIKVTIAYQPESFRLGLYVSVTSLLLLFFVSLKIFKTIKKS